VQFVVRYLSLFLRNIIASELSSVLFLDEERPAPVAVIARNGPSSSPPTGSRASSADHIWIKLLRLPFVVVLLLFHPGMRNLDEGTDDETNGWKGRRPPVQNQGYYISR
jgi:hypothetical protein